MEIIKTFDWVMGHRLAFHRGGCQNIHGHNYTAKVTITGPVDEATGFVMDFSDLKKEMQPILKDLDHSFMWYTGDGVMEQIFASNSDLKNKGVSFQPTAENIAKYIWDTLSLQS